MLVSTGATGVWAMHPLTSQFITTCISVPHPLGSFVNLLPHLAIVHQQRVLAGIKRPTQYSQQVKGSCASPLFSACETASGVLCLFWPRPPEAPSNPNYSMITKVLLYLTPRIAHFITHRPQLSPPGLHSVFNCRRGYQAGGSGTCPRNDIRIILSH